MIRVDAGVGEPEIKLFVKPRSGSDLEWAALSEWLSGKSAGNALLARNRPRPSQATADRFAGLRRDAVRSPNRGGKRASL